MTDFCPATREKVFEYVCGKYNTQPEYPWGRLPAYAVLRHPNGKWYAILMNVPSERLGIPSGGRTDILVAKCEQALQPLLLSQNGFLPAYHLNKEHWISARLDGSTTWEQVRALMDMSHELTGRPARRAFLRGEETWIVPVNPKYYDIEKAFSESDEIIWKQSNNILAGDSVYLYIASPLSAIAYACRVLEAGIPYHFDNGKVHMERVMRLKLVRRLAPPMPLSALKKYGIFTVRGPVRMPYGLRFELETKK